MDFVFKQENPDESKRIVESNKIREKYKDRIPVICERRKNDIIKEIDKSKFLVPMDLNFTQFIAIIRKKIILDRSNQKSIVLSLLVMGKDKKQYSETGDKLMSEIYEKHKDTDGFLYIIYTGEISMG